MGRVLSPLSRPLSGCSPKRTLNFAGRRSGHAIPPERCEQGRPNAPPAIDDSQRGLVEALEIELRHMSYFDRLPPEDRGWVGRMLVRLLAVYACLMLLVVAGAGLRIGVVEPLTMGSGDVPMPGTTDRAAVSDEPAAQMVCAPRDCLAAALEDPAPNGVPTWTLGARD